MSKRNPAVGNNNREAIRKERRTWGGVNPVTKIIPDKRRKPPKHKGRPEEE